MFCSLFHFAPASRPPHLPARPPTSRPLPVSYTHLAEQIAFIHEANTEVRKKELFSKVRTGQVRVLLGSTQKMGAGTNVQDRLVALHDLDCPWRPGDLALSLIHI